MGPRASRAPSWCCCLDYLALMFRVQCAFSLTLPWLGRSANNNYSACSFEGGLEPAGAPDGTSRQRLRSSPGSPRDHPHRTPHPFASAAHESSLQALAPKSKVARSLHLGIPQARKRYRGKTCRSEIRVMLVKL